METLVNRFLDQVGVILTAPMPFIIAALIVAWLAYRFAVSQSSTQIADLNTRVSLRDDQIENYKQKLERASLELQAEGPSQRPVVPSVENRPTESPSLPARELPATAPAAQEINSPRYLMGLFRDKTSFHAEKEAAKFLGKTITLTGSVGDIKPHGNDKATVFLDVVPIVPETLGDWMALTIVVLYFSHDLERLSPLEKGDKITVRGKLESVGRSNMTLTDCELIEAPPQAA